MRRQSHALPPAQRRAPLDLLNVGNTSVLAGLGEDSQLDLMGQLAQKERECEKLQDQVDILQADLTSRPPKSEVDELMREFRIQESLLSGYQRENEKASREIDKGKLRERVLESHLETLVGPNWATSLGISHLPSTSPQASPTLQSANPMVQRASSHSRPTSSSPLTKPTFIPSPIEPDHSVDGADGLARRTEEEKERMGRDKREVLIQLDGFRELMKGLERRIEQREGELRGVLVKAEEESRSLAST